MTATLNNEDQPEFKFGDTIRITDGDSEFWDSIGHVELVVDEEVKVRLTQHQRRITTFAKNQIEHYHARMGGAPRE